MSNKELIELLEQYKRVLIASATGGEVTDKEFAEVRGKLIASPALKNKLPSFVKIYRTPREFFSYCQSMYDTYRDRRTYIAEQINPLINELEAAGTDEFNKLDSFSPEKALGDGGFGVVYPYHHSILDLDFAVKQFAPVFADAEEQSEGEKRFFREAKMLFSLHHDNIVQIYNAGYINGNAYILMELIKGFNLEKMIEKYSVLPYKKSLIPISQILRGLSYAHNKGIIHRDLKPRNVMFSETEKLFKIIDFGVSAYIEHDSHTRLTKTGESVTGGLYIDPQLESNPKLRDVRSDIYSVGAIWYFLLAGTPPYGSDMKDKLLKFTGIAEEKAAIIFKCLSSELSDRYNSCQELLEIVEKEIHKA